MAHYATDQERIEAEAARQAREDAAKAEQAAAFENPGYGAGEAAPPPPPPPEENPPPVA